jgi:hypothetical protein
MNSELGIMNWAAAPEVKWLELVIAGTCVEKPGSIRRQEKDFIAEVLLVGFGGKCGIAGFFLKK